MKNIYYLTLLSAFLGTHPSALAETAEALDCSRIAEEYEAAEQALALGFEAGDRAAEVARQVHETQTASADDSDFLKENNAELARAASEMIDALDRIQRLLAQEGTAPAESITIGRRTAILGIADVIHTLKAPAMRFLYAGLSVLECKERYEAGFVPECAALKITPYYIRKVSITGDTRIKIGPNTSGEEIRAAMLREPETVGQTTVDLYEQFKTSAFENFDVVRHILATQGCQGVPVRKPLSVESGEDSPEDSIQKTEESAEDQLEAGVGVAG